MTREVIQMTREVIQTKTAPAPVGPYNQAIATSGLLLLLDRFPSIQPQGNWWEEKTYPSKQSR